MANDVKFRELNENERKSTVIAAEKGKISYSHPIYSSSELCKVSYEYLTGGFCVCIVLVPKTISKIDTSVLVYRGVSRRSYKDKNNKVKGEMLAFSRALLLSKSVEI